MCYAKQLKRLVEFLVLQTQAEQLNIFIADQAAIVIEGIAVTGTNTKVSGKIKASVTVDKQSHQCKKSCVRCTYFNASKVYP